jgi:expansin (peptidoglycan-binding protein)
MVGTQTGQMTYYATGLGACGITNDDQQHIAAVSHLLFDAFPGYNDINPNNNPVCGRKIKISYLGAEVIVTVTDRCAACELTDLDLSPAAFQLLGALGIGRLFGATWVWLN